MERYLVPLGPCREGGCTLGPVQRNFQSPSEVELAGSVHANFPHRMFSVLKHIVRLVHSASSVVALMPTTLPHPSQDSVIRASGHVT